MTGVAICKAQTTSGVSFMDLMDVVAYSPEKTVWA